MANKNTFKVAFYCFANAVANKTFIKQSIA